MDYKEKGKESERVEGATRVVWVEQTIVVTLRMTWMPVQEARGV